MTKVQVIRRERPRTAAWPVASVKVPETDLRLIDAAAGLLSRREGGEVTRSDVLYTGTMRFVREVLGLPGEDLREALKAVGK
jgi:hypothetical protein